jgi:hypothetical protein
LNSGSIGPSILEWFVPLPVREIEVCPPEAGGAVDCWAGGEFRV